MRDREPEREEVRAVQFGAGGVVDATPRIDKCPECGAVLVVRSAEQNSKLHALLTDIAMQKEWAGQWLDVEDWKRLIVSAFERANKQSARIFPSLDGQGIDMIYRRTHRMSKQEMSEVIEYATAWAVKQGVRLRDTVPDETLQQEFERHPVR